MTLERRRHTMHAVRNKNGGSTSMFASASFFLVLSMFACFGVSPVWSSPRDEYAGWFSQSDTQTNDGSSSSSSSSYLPPPPGVASSQKKLQKCIFDNVLAIDEEESVILLRETLMVDGCLLECGNKIIHSTVRGGSIVTVRNGGHVKNCTVALVKEKDLEEALANIDSLDNIFEGGEEDETTSAPTVWGTDYTTGFAPKWIKDVTLLTRYNPYPVAGFLCDQGDCVLENSYCSALEFDPADPPVNMLMLIECVLVQVGATDVRVQGGLVTAENRPVSFFGIAVDAGFNPATNSSPEDENDNAKARLFVDNVTIRNQLKAGIIVVGGANTVRITDSTISNNKFDGVQVSGGYGLAFFSVFGGSIEDNGICGIKINVNDDQLAAFPTNTQMMISDVLVKNNGEDGLEVVRGVDDVVIDGAIFDGNGLDGIDIWNAATISLQGVISKNNVWNGLSVEAVDCIVEIANSLFLNNGINLRRLKKPWKRAGVYLWLPKQATITNSVSNGNSLDGIIIYDVPDLKFTDVDVMGNGNDGIEIRESNAGYDYEYTTTSDYLVGAYYYPWHGENFHNGGGYLRKELTPPQSPTLGEYDDSDPDVISQHLEWFRKSNIGLLVTSWWGPDRIEDTNTIKILQHDYIGNVKIALHYETTGRIKEEAGDDMSLTQSDIEYMCENYFDHPNYYKIDNRPVLVVYISRKLEQLGTLESALLTMRSVASKCGHNIYLIGDAVFAKAPEVNDEEPFVSFRYFDAVTNYDVYGSSGATKQDSPYAGTESIDNFYAEQEKWRKLALEENCRYIPPVSPGYNDRAVRMEKNNQPLSRRLTASSEEGSMFKYQLEKALPLVDPELDNLILVNSFNEWHEDTQIEPVRVVDSTIDSLEDDSNVATEPEEFTFGLEYVGYGELYLNILRNATTTLVAEKGELETSYVPTYVDFTNVRTCKNGADGMRFYVTDNSRDDQTEFVFKTGPGVISCENKKFDYEMYGAGNVDFLASPTDGIVGDKCANGKESVGCEFQNLMKSCKNIFCHHRDIVTTGGGVINEHKIQ